MRGGMDGRRLHAREAATDRDGARRRAGAGEARRVAAERVWQLAVQGARSAGGGRAVVSRLRGRGSPAPERDRAKAHRGPGVVDVEGDKRRVEPDQKSTRGRSEERRGGK